MTAAANPVPASGQATDPSWLSELIRDYQAGVASTFILYGAVSDYVSHPTRNLPVREHLALRMSERFSVATFSPDGGVEFPGLPSDEATTRRRFMAAIGAVTAGLSQAEQLMAAAGMGAPADAKVDLPKSPSAALPMLVDFASTADGREVSAGGDGSGKRAVVIVDRLDLVAPPADKGTMPEPQRALLSLLHRAGTVRAVTRLGNLIVLLAPSLEEVHPDLRAASAGIRTIEVPPATFEERLAFAERCVASKTVSLEMSIAELASATAGLGRRHIEDIVLRAKAAGGVVTRALVTERKREMLSTEYAEVIEVMEPKFRLADVGGHDLAKAYLRDWVIGPLLDDKLRDMVPLGLMLVGPAGTGKTMLVDAIAFETGLNAIILRPDKIKGSYVGESERKLATAIRGIKAFAPCLLFIDEVDQKVRRGQGSDGGSAVENNLFGSLLEFLGDSSHRGQIVAVAATNRPDTLDPALARRLETPIPILAPDTADERVAVLTAQIRRYRPSDVVDADRREILTEIGEQTDGFTQAELEKLVVRANGISRIQGLDFGRALVAARRRMRASTREVQEMTMIALAACDDLELIPERWRALVEQTSRTPVGSNVETARGERSGLDF